MREIRTMLLGAGRFGISWATEILPLCGDTARLEAVADRDRGRLKMLPGEVRTFEDLEEAIEEVKPELVINATQPSAHLSTNRMLLEHGVPVLCEKPLADSLEAAEETGRILRKTGGFLMIAENYRFSPVMRAAKACLLSGRLGGIHRIHCLFRHEHPDYSAFYHGKLRHPLLEDVAIHHLDLARYLTGEEPRTVECRADTAPYSWYGERFASSGIRTEMTGGVLFEYSGTLASPVTTTPWNGRWEIECERGVLQILDDRLYVTESGGREELEIDTPDGVSRALLLKEACSALREHRRGETDYTDNIRTYRWMQAAVRSSETKETVRMGEEAEEC